uniref:Uncharacterized protein n=1 Tax=Arundo donax TaxID=35708 RepID=A0A0A9ADT1_ARUDO
MQIEVSLMKDLLQKRPQKVLGPIC